MKTYFLLYAVCGLMGSNSNDIYITHQKHFKTKKECSEELMKFKNMEKGGEYLDMGAPRVCRDYCVNVTETYRIYWDKK